MAKRYTLKTSTDIMKYLSEKYYSNRCFVTLEKYKSKGFVIHHLWYINNDVERKNYPKGETGRYKYLKALLPLIEKEPWRFVLIKNGIHTRLDHIRRGLTRMKSDNFTRLVLLVFMSKKRNKKIK